jgi:hypothetical protein
MKGADMKLSAGKITFFFGFVFVAVGLGGCGPKPASVEIVPGEVVLEGAGAQQKLEARVLDEEGKVIPGFTDIVWFSEDMKHIKLSADGTVTAVASGEAKVDVEVVNTQLKATVKIRIKIAASVKVSHERLRLWTGQVKEDVCAEVLSEKGAFIEGYLPTWKSDDPDIVKVEPIVDPNRRQSWVRMTGMKSGITYIYAKYKDFSQQIRVAVFDEDEEVAMDGTRIPKGAKKNSSK